MKTKTFISCSPALFLLASLFSVPLATHAAVTLINFDDVAAGTLINTHYAGVTFTNPIGGNVFAKSGLGFAPSSPNVVTITNGGNTFPFFDSVSGAVDARFASPMRSVSIDVRPVGPVDSFLTPLTSKPYLQAFDAAGNLLATVYDLAPLPTNCCYDVGPVQTLSFTSTSANIARARLSSQQPNPFHTYGLFDNLRYDDGYYNLTLSIVGSGNVLTSPFPGPYSYGSVVTLAATPSQDWSFSGWSGDITSTLNPLLPIMNSDKTLTATFVPAPQPGPNFVVTTTDDHDDGIAGFSDCTLREAINAANANPDASTITFAPNVTNVITLTLGELDVTHDLTILGPGTKVLSISGNNNGRIFNMVAGTIRVSDLIITRGRVVGLTGGAGAVGGGTGGAGGSAFGGGIFNSSVLTLSNCWIGGNAVQGGVGGVGGQDDSAHPAGIGGTGGLGEGGGIYTGVNSLTLINCTISGNSCVGGAAGTGSDAFDNYPSDVGGAGGAGGGSAGGAVFNTAYLYVTNCTFSGNTCTGGAGGNGGNGYADAVGGAGGAGGAGAGGGIVSTYDFRMASCTISLNSLYGGAGGLGTAGRNGVPPNGSPGSSLGGGLYSTTFANSVQNSLIAGNTALVAPDCVGFFTTLGYNLVGITNSSIGFANITDQAGNLVTPLNPLLGPLVNLGGPTPTMAPLPGSPALDKGNRGVLNADQRGRPRPIDIASIANAPGGDSSDIGSFELNQSVLKITKVLNNIVLSWPANDAGFTLQSTAQLASPTIWTTVPVSPAIGGGEYTVTASTAAGKQFYRLIWVGIATIPGIYNTGVGANGALLAAGAVDPHWQLIQSADGSFPGPNAIVVNDAGFPIPPWIANGPVSKWLAPQANQSSGNPPGDYKYRITFNLTGLEPSTAVINGYWTSDDTGPQVLLNGTPTGATSDGNFGALGNAFTINTGFIAGVNTLDFVVTNGGSGINPTGVRVELSGTANRQPPP